MSREEVMSYAACGPNILSTQLKNSVLKLDEPTKQAQLEKSSTSTCRRLAELTPALLNFLF